MSSTAVLNEQKAQQFGERAFGIVNDAFIAIGLSVGHQTGLFDTLAKLPPSTSDEIARAANLNERYVREWLGAMTTGRIVDYDAAGHRYSLPAEHAAALTREAGADNMAHLAQFVSVLAPVEPMIVEAFRNGGGVGYEHYPRFARLMRDDSALVFDTTLLKEILPLVPGAREQLEAGIAVADIGCGAGHAINILARRFPASSFTGFDLSTEALTIAREEAADWGLTNARFVEQDVAALGKESEYDLITAFDVIHDQAEPRKVLSGIARALRPGGTFLMADIAGSSKLENNLENPLGPFGYSVSYLHCMTVSLAAGGEGLGTMWGEELARDLLAEAGFGNVDVRQVEGDAFNNYYITRK